MVLSAIYTSTEPFEPEAPCTREEEDAEIVQLSTVVCLGRRMLIPS